MRLITPRSDLSAATLIEGDQWHIHAAWPAHDRQRTLQGDGELVKNADDNRPTTARPFIEVIAL
ncbi:hypothetical protein SHIRM173S_05406 [Streptomyces hirsutus]